VPAVITQQGLDEVELTIVVPNVKSDARDCSRLTAEALIEVLEMA
jgi:hypothetical protein